MEQSLLVITDIGSTTTKAVLFRVGGVRNEPVGIFGTPTTVEAPTEDVKIGVFNSIRGLERQTGIPLMDETSTPTNFGFHPGVEYLTTSSAGGGLQILVIGLTTFDSASSARRTAYGSGGVILDTFAIDDKRSALEQILAIRSLKPDLILFAGGVDGGAVSGVVRMAEILVLAEPKPKFRTDVKIPLVFAGNKDAVPVITPLFEPHFDLHVVPNIRPDMDRENLAPAQEKIHELFMENVMERAPGYDTLKPVVKTDIIPTPAGVLRTLEALSRKVEANVVAIDIGGATTDVFTNINGKFHRTVSANLGMSYSLLNTLSEAGPEAIRRWLPWPLPDEVVTNYIGNKTLNPTREPVALWEVAIEQAVAREAIRLAERQHLEMHYNLVKVGFLDRLKKSQRDPFMDHFLYDRIEEDFRFHESDIDLVVGAGGVISHCPSPLHALIMLIDGLQPCGVTKIWRDRDFLSPHIGVLAENDPDLALDLLNSSCFEELGIHIRPLSKKVKPDRKVMDVGVIDAGNQTNLVVQADEIYFFPATKDEKQFTIITGKDHRLTEATTFTLNTRLPVVIDTRSPETSLMPRINALMGLFPDSPGSHDTPMPYEFGSASLPVEKEHQFRIELPYNGEIHVSPGQRVEPGTLVGENRFDPPRIFIVDPKLPAKGVKGNIPDAMMVRIGDLVQPDQKLVDGQVLGLSSSHWEHGRYLHCPVRGRVEAIDTGTGAIILREEQDYSTRPIQVHIAHELGVPPREAKGYMVRSIGDFVYQGDVLARRMLPVGGQSMPTFVKSPSTGRITVIDRDNGTMTVHYDTKPLRRFANVHGTVSAIMAGHSADITARGMLLEGRIGFGTNTNGILAFVNEEAALDSLSLGGKIIATDFSPTPKFLQLCLANKVVGMVVPGLHEEDAVQWIGREIGVVNTGNEVCGFPIMLMCGFGSYRMPSPYADFLKSHSGRHVFLNTETRVRAGVVRPGLLIQ